MAVMKDTPAMRRKIEAARKKGVMAKFAKAEGEDQKKAVAEKKKKK